MTTDRIAESAIGAGSELANVREREHYGRMCYKKQSDNSDGLIYSLIGH